MQSVRGVSPHRLSARMLAAEIAAGRQTSESVVRDCLERIASRENVVHAWSFLDPELAIRQARAIDRGPYRGVLHGVPVAIKDVIDTCDMPTAYGSPIYAGHRPFADAGCVAMSRAAGAVVLGKTVTTEFATSHPGMTTNPHNARHTPGGSSSGSAAAVADFMVPLALGTQTGGSIIRPASFCGIVGLKPSFGMVNRAGVKQISESLDTVGILARSVADAALLLAATTGRPEMLEIDSVRPVRVGLCEGPDWESAAPESRDALHRVADVLRASGVGVDDVVLPPSFAGLQKAHHDVDYFEMARSLHHEYTQHADQLTPALTAQIRRGLACSPADYENGRRLAGECGAALDTLLETMDLLLTPGAPGEAPAGLTSTGKSVFNRTWTLLGSPCLALPTARGPNGLPVGVQLVGRARHDARLLRCGRWIEELLR